MIEEQQKIEYSSPRSLSETDISDFLEKIGISGGIINSYVLSSALGTISQRQIRRAAMTGKITAIDMRPLTLSRVDVVRFLQANPRYISGFIPKMEVTPETTEHIRRVIRMSWRTLLKFMDEEDIVSEVHLMMLRSNVAKCSEERVISGCLSKIYRKIKRSPRTISLDAICERIASREE